MALAPIQVRLPQTLRRGRDRGRAPMSASEPSRLFRFAARRPGARAPAGLARTRRGDAYWETAVPGATARRAPAALRETGIQSGGGEARSAVAITSREDLEIIRERQRRRR